MSSISVGSSMSDSKEFSHPQNIGEYHLGDVIGRGAYGCVYKGLNIHTGDFAAIKRVDKTRLNEKTAVSVKGELELLRKLSHPTILKVYDCAETDEDLYLILEYMENGSLVSVLDKFGPLPEALVILYLQQALVGLKYLHENNVLHRDIKAANILINKEGDIKLADFGVASDINKDATAKYSVVGSPYWMAPEAIELSGTPSGASDIWSIGATTLELLTGQPPYFSLSPISAIFRIVQEPHPPIPNSVSESMKDFVMRCFVKDPAARPTATELLAHPIFARETIGSKRNKPSYKELKNTLKTLHRTGSRKKANSIDWSPVAVPPLSPDTKPKLANSMTRTVAQENTIKILQDELDQEKQMRKNREETIQHLTLENDELRKRLREGGSTTQSSQEEFYKDYFITIAMSVKRLNHSRGKDFRINMQELMDKAREEKLAIHDLIEWIPKQIETQRKHNAKLGKNHVY